MKGYMCLVIGPLTSLSMVVSSEHEALAQLDGEVLPVEEDNRCPAEGSSPLCPLVIRVISQVSYMISELVRQPS